MWLWCVLLPLALGIREQAWYSPSTRSVARHLDHQDIVDKTAIDLCSLPADIGGCTKELIRYYYDPKDDECKRFTFTGCGGNSNRFMRRAHCRNRCVKDKEVISGKTEDAVVRVPGISANTHKEAKHRRTITTTTTTVRPTTPSTTTTTTTTTPAPLTRPVRKIEKTEISPSIRACPHCDPLFGICVDGECGCVPGFKKLGRICIDLNECDSSSACPSNSRCVNTVGSFRCDCDAGFSEGGECIVTPEACLDPFDIMLTEEDCNHGEQLIRYYFDVETSSCKQFFYGGCKSTSKNFFSDVQTCDSLCAQHIRQEAKVDHVSPVAAQEEESRGLGYAPNLDLGIEKPEVVIAETIEEKKEGATKIIDIMKSINPNDNNCLREFDEVLRLECMTASWEEKFYWNSNIKECEPFWYDSSCDPRDAAGKNLFDSLDVCQKTCHEEVDPNEPKKMAVVEVEAQTEAPRILPTEAATSAPDVESDPNEISFSHHEEQPPHEHERVPHPLEDIEITPRRTKTTKKPERLKEERTEKHRDDPMALIVPTELPKATLPPFTTAGPRLDSGNFAPKTASTAFDKAKYMEEFKKKLNSLPDSFVKKQAVELPTLSATKRPLFTLPPSVFEEAPVVEEKKEESAPEPEKPSSNERVQYATDTEQAGTQVVDGIVPMDKHTSKGVKHFSGSTDAQWMITTFTKKPTTAVTKKLAPTDFVTMEKKKVEKTLSELSKDTDLCDEPLHPRLEEDCSNEDWVIRWFFNPDIGACKTFWYGRCKVEARNFFLSLKDCKAACAHKMAVEDDMLRPKYLVRPEPEEIEQKGPVLLEVETPTTTSTTTTAPKVVELFPANDPFEAAPRPTPDAFSYELPLDHPTPSEPLRRVDPFENVAQTAALQGGPFEEHRHAGLPTIPDPWVVQTTSIPDQATTAAAETTTAFIQRNVDEAPPRIVETTVEARRADSNDIVEHIAEPTEQSKDKNEIGGTDLPSDPCSHGYDEKWDEDCSNDDWQVRAYFDQKTNGCKKFWWGGCTTKNRNVWKDQQDCITACGHKMTPRAPFAPYTQGTTDTQPSSASTQSNAPSNMIVGSPKHMMMAPDYEPPHASPLVQFSVSEPQPADFASARLDVDTIILTATAKPKRKFEFKLRTNVVQTTYVVARRSRDEPQNDAPAPDEPETTPAVAEEKKPTPETRKEPFLADLGLQLAQKKRDEEAREDLAYSNRVNHPVTVASECLESFDVNLTKSCFGGAQWKNRFYYDRDMRTCRMFWNDGCFSTSKNNFEDLESCQWKCEGRHPEPNGRSCLDHFAPSYLEDCRHGEFTSRFFFDHSKKRCTAFHWGGCRSDSENFFTDMAECQELCETPPRQLTQACVEPFDHSYRDSCSSDGRFQQYYFFDHATHSCRMFWFGNCRGKSQNIFPSLETCQWICERHREERVPGHCADQFDTKYTEACGQGNWIEKWHFEQNTGECVSFWWDGCTSTSQNIFPDENSCKTHCVYPGYSVESRLPDPETKYRCLEPVEIGTCRETYPAFYYDRIGKECRPFAYSGCGGNGNRFMTMAQCQGLCYPFNQMTEPEMDCHQPMHIGYGKNDDHCSQNAGYRFYYDRDYGRCSQMWYMGCGGNANNFYSFEVCQRTCKSERRRLERRPRESSNVCFKAAGASGKCPSKVTRPVQRWTYSSQRCVSFTYNGCGGTANRFATEKDCEDVCKGHRPSADPVTCSHQPNWGQCNQLRYMWFYNETRGTCDQFLYGGCGGNTNKFESFEICQKKCEISGIDPCLESLDRGNWCEAMSNRYYFNKKTKQCRGFHYTGCGKSGNNFLSSEECHLKYDMI